MKLKLKEVREAAGISQSALARRADMHASSVSSIEKGRLEAWPGQRLKLAEALGWPAEDADELFIDVDRQALVPSALVDRLIHIQGLIYQYVDPAYIAAEIDEMIAHIDESTCGGNRG